MAPKPEARIAIEAVGIDGVISKIEEGDSLTKIAKGIGVARGSLVTWIDADPDRSARARSAIEAAAEADDERALEAIEALNKDSTPGDIAKAREKASHHRWRAKIKNPRRYGDRIQADVTHRFTDMDDADLNAELAALLGSGGA